MDFNNGCGQLDFRQNSILRVWFCHIRTLTDNTIDTFGNRTIVDFYWNASNTVQLNIANGPNSGWSSISVGGMTFSKCASYGNNLWFGQVLRTTIRTSGNKTIQFNI